MQDIKFLIIYLLASLSTALFFHKWENVKLTRTLIIAIGTLALLTGSATILLSPEQNVLYQLITLDFLSSRTDTMVVLFGCTTGIPVGIALSNSGASKSPKVIAIFFFTISIAAGSILCSKSYISKFLSDPNATASSGVITKSVIAGWGDPDRIPLPIAPTCICLDDSDTVYAAGYVGYYNQSGSVVRVNQPPRTTSLVANGLTRPHGIAFHNSSLFVSRAGQYSIAKSGVYEQLNTGAITQIRDLDQDGIFEYYDDIVSDLPGAKLPDGLHQNNAIAFSPQGDLYLTVGNVSNRGPARHPFEGSILVLRQGDTEPSVFARGFRNPYGLCVSKSGEVFCTDNDPNEKNPGDKLIHVEKGKHHGHPYDAAEGISVDGSVKEIARLSSAQGIDAVPEHLVNIFGGDLIIANYGDDTLSVFNTTSNTVKFFATVPGVVDVSVDSKGNVVACSYQDSMLYIFPKEAVR